MLTTKDVALNLYSFGYYGGFIKDEARSKPPLGIDGLVALVDKYKLGGIEIPFDHFFSSDEIQNGITYLREIKESGRSVFIDLEKTNPVYIKLLLPMLSQLEIKVVRIKMDQIGKTIYGGNRYLSETFDEAVKVFQSQLKELVPYLENYDVCLAIENHQDFHSSELKKIVEETSTEYIGITWDVGNSSSVCDSPETFYKTLEPYIRNVHLKDYSLVKSANGIKLIRCPFGEGFVDYRHILPMLYQNDRVVNMSIELGAQITRECDLNFSQYWDALDSASIDRDSFLHFVDENAKVDTKVSYSEYKKDVSEDLMIESELNDIEISVKNLNQIISSL